MRTPPKIVMAGLVAVALLLPLRAGAPQQIIPAPPAPPAAPAMAPPATPPQPAMVPERVAPAVERPAAQVLPPREGLRQGMPQQMPSHAQQVAPGPGRPPEATDAPRCPPELAAECRAAKAAEMHYTKRYYESLGEDLELRRQAFEWHEFSTKALFWSVIAITAMGLVLSWREFGKYYERKPPGGSKGAAGAQAGPKEPGAEAPPQSVFKVGAQGLEVTSSLIGFLVLTVSLVFFYLYVVNVYPLYEISAAQATAASTKQGSGSAAKQ